MGSGLTQGPGCEPNVLGRFPRPRKPRSNLRDSRGCRSLVVRAALAAESLEPHATSVEDRAPAASKEDDHETTVGRLADWPLRIAVFGNTERALDAVAMTITADLSIDDQAHSSTRTLNCLFPVLTVVHTHRRELDSRTLMLVPESRKFDAFPLEGAVRPREPSSRQPRFQELSSRSIAGPRSPSSSGSVERKRRTLVSTGPACCSPVPRHIPGCTLELNGRFVWSFDAQG